jgi:hypothetical protein
MQMVQNGDDSVTWSIVPSRVGSEWFEDPESELVPDD